MHRSIFFLCVPLVCFLLISTSLYLGRDHITRLSETYLPLYAPNQVATTSTETIPSFPSSSTSTSKSSYTVYAEKVSSSTISSYTTTATISSTTTSATSINSAIPIKNGEISFIILETRLIRTDNHQALYYLPSASHLISTPSSIPHPKSAHD